jgi:4-hydroxy-tetrahydrodipicolinate synthase
MWHGCFTALVTPFRDGEIDQLALAKLVEGQIEAGVRGLVVAGTTGEAPTLSRVEYQHLLSACMKHAAGRVPMIAGTGTYSTQESIDRTQLAAAAGASAAMIVAPYYNRPGPRGLRLHFEMVADRSPIPILLYNIPSRTGSEIPVSLAIELASHERIEAIKDAAQSATQAAELIASGALAVLSGDDALTLPWMALGATGVVSVASNVAPGPLVALVEAAAAGDFELARKWHYLLQPLFRSLFLESNPVPAKALLELLGRCSAEVRAPLVMAQESTRDALWNAWSVLQEKTASRAVAG